jgi:putative tricarboxylic transport membrane protein
MMSRPFPAARLAALASFAAAAFGALPAAAELDSLSILAPASPGGGWDQTARAMQAALQTAGIVSDVEVTNVSGAGGTIGLAQFVSNAEGDGSQLIVGGLVMVGAILTNQSPVTLDQVTPLASLTGEYEVIVVPASSDIQTMGDLVEKLKADPGSVAWGGGSAGGTDHILVGLIAKAAGVEPAAVNYIPFSGGGEALAALLANDVTAGVSGLGEFQGQIEAGELRALALSSPERVEGIEIPTLKEQGIDVELTNWRAVMAAPGIDDAEKQALADAIAKMVESEPWQTTLKDRGWMNLYQPADEFAAFLAQDRATIEATLKDIGLVQ